MPIMKCMANASERKGLGEKATVVKIFFVSCVIFLIIIFTIIVFGYCKDMGKMSNHVIRERLCATTKILVEKLIFDEFRQEVVNEKVMEIEDRATVDEIIRIISNGKKYDGPVNLPLHQYALRIFDAEDQLSEVLLMWGGTDVLFQGDYFGYNLTGEENSALKSFIIHSDS